MLLNIATLLLLDCHVPYSGKLSWEKTFANFAVLLLFAKVFFATFEGVVFFGAAKASNLRKFSPRKSYLSPIRGSFLPRKFPSIQYFKDVGNLIVLAHVNGWRVYSA